MTKTDSQRIAGLDSIRFIAAMWVVFGHCGYFPLTEGIDKSNLIGWLVNGVYANTFAAVPAVMVFFVVSGFCIHFPHRNDLGLDLRPYFIRRYVRICAPLIAAVCISIPLNVNLSLFHNSILWSLLAELIYYTIYPILRIARGAIGWDRLIVASFLGAFFFVSLQPQADDFSPFGSMLNWIIAFPCWLMGCRLAEVNFEAGLRQSSYQKLLKLRGLVWVLSSLCSVLRFHSPIGYPWTLNIFGIVVYFWLRAEIVYYRTNRPWQLMEWLGKWSYSIYLTHLLSSSLLISLALPNFGFNINWFVKIGFILVFAYLFYLCFELPSHHLARTLAKKQKVVSEPSKLACEP